MLESRDAGGSWGAATHAVCLPQRQYRSLSRYPQARTRQSATPYAPAREMQGVAPFVILHNRTSPLMFEKESCLRCLH